MELIRNEKQIIRCGDEGHENEGGDGDDDDGDNCSTPTARTSLPSLTSLTSLDATLELDWFLFEIEPHLSFEDLRLLSQLNQRSRRAIHDWMGQLWPLDVRGIFDTWCGCGPCGQGGQCGTTPSTVLVFGVHRALKLIQRRFYARHPAPIVQLSFDELYFDRSNDRLIGNPWKEVSISTAPNSSNVSSTSNPSTASNTSCTSYTSNVSNAPHAPPLQSPQSPQPLSLGRFEPIVCAANDAGSKIFYCGGSWALKPSVSQQNPLNPLSPLWVFGGDLDRQPSNACGLFDVRTGVWETLPPMPSARYASGVCRIGSRIYIIGGVEDEGRMGRTHPCSVLCFDLVRKVWVDSKDWKCRDFPGQAYRNFAVVPLNTLHGSSILVAGGVREVVGWQDPHHPEHEIGLSFEFRIEPSREVYCLNICSGSWTRLADLPNVVCASLGRGSLGKGVAELPVQFTGFVLESLQSPRPRHGVDRVDRVDRVNSPIAVIFCNDMWAQLLPSGEWQVKPDLRKYRVPMIRLEDQPLEDQSQYWIFTGNSWRRLPPENQVWIEDMKLCLDKHCRIVRMLV